MFLLITGLTLTIPSWALAWSRTGLLSEYSFFPLWLGYILTVNGVAEFLVGTSLLRSMSRFTGVLFLSSVPLWWFFEGMNLIVQNWHYHLSHPISTFHYFLQASINFSTVVPAVLSTGFLCYQYGKQKGWLVTGKPLSLDQHHRVGVFSFGVLAFLLLPIFPHETFPLVWLAPVLVLEPVAYAARLPSLLRELEAGRYLLVVAIMTGTMFAGICWELWNYYALPKWTYDVPYVGFWKVFEMPLLGYLGYPFFGLIVFSWASIIFAVVFRTDLLQLFESPVRVG